LISVHIFHVTWYQCTHLHGTRYQRTYSTVLDTRG
jgi:hypothetical protein